MSYTYLQGPEGESSAEFFADIPQYVLSRLNLTAGKSCCSASEMESCHTSPSGTTCEHSTGDHGAKKLISYAGDFHAKIYQQQEKVPVSKESAAASGLKCLGSLARFDLDSHLWKTHQYSLLVGLDEFSETWPRWGMMRGGECWELSMPVLPTSETESGSLPTPRATDGDKGTRTAQGAAKEWARGRNKDLGMIVAMWPTPQAHKTTRSGEIVNADGTPWNGITKPHSKTSGRPITTALADAVALWPTPTAHNAKETNAPSESKRNTPTLAAQAGGHLNPTWVEWLMGWPLGWTDLKPLETDRFQQWLDSHGTP